jgi:hypothetical protein
MAASPGHLVRANLAWQACSEGRRGIFFLAILTDAFFCSYVRFWPKADIGWCSRARKHCGGNRRHARGSAQLRRGFAARLNLESAVRAWAVADRKARAAVDTVDAERVRYLKNLLAEAGVDPNIAESRAWLIIWAYLGRSLSLQRMKDEELQAIVDDLSRLMRLRVDKQP